MAQATWARLNSTLGAFRAMKRLCILLSLITFVAGCRESRYDRAFELDNSTFDAEAMQMIHDDTGLLVPAGARGLNFAYKPPIDPAFLARIAIPADSRKSVEA